VTCDIEAVSGHTLTEELALRFQTLLAMTTMMVSSTFKPLHADWKPAPSPLLTSWAEKVDPKLPWPEYPRPQLVRDRWWNLNGLWDYAITPRDAGPPASYDGSILVPFCIESALSGVGKRVGAEQALWYRRTFSTPAVRAGERTILHFGGVDWQAHVYVNGQLVAQHEGGHTPFGADVTGALKSSGENELVVRAWDPTDKGSQPRGKQVANPHGIWYTPVTGIWQTVWTETVAAVYIHRLKLTPDVDASTLTIEANLRGSGDVYDIEAKAIDGATVIASTSGQSNAPLTLNIPNSQLWSPDSPTLYDLMIVVKRDGQVVDEVKSYFAMRKISFAKDAAGYERLMLNNQPLFHIGPLDQGWWPDGLYTAPTDEALAWDIQFTKDLGLNMCRKHIKVEPARWYYHCDRLGLMVWQDQSSGMGEGRQQGVRVGAADDAVFTPQEKVQFRAELKAMIDMLHNSPSVVVWVPFNEGWGQHDTNDVLKWVKAYDPTRVVGGPSGWEDRGYGDLHDLHSYPGPGMFTAQPGRVSVLGEFGGLGLPVAGHLWQDTKNWGYRSYPDQAGLQAAYLDLVERLQPLAARGLAAAVYTQTTDVEIEVNGYATYDRKVVKFDKAPLAEAHAQVIAAANRPAKFVILAPTSEDTGQTYRYTTQSPPDGWNQPGFDDSSWQQGEGIFGSPGRMIRTEWLTPEIWLRRAVRIEKKPGEGTRLSIRHDEDAKVYINGVLALDLKGRVRGHVEHALPPEALAALEQGENVIAVYCKQRVGGQAIDVGLLEQTPLK
jgi:Glycosyl hydrolases family 2, sugar binding domain/Glycosyl hydrolases family 2/Glycosyl hydrolases family 2, TIM barrel domain